MSGEVDFYFALPGSAWPAGSPPNCDLGAGVSSKSCLPINLLHMNAPRLALPASGQFPKYITNNEKGPFCDILHRSQRAFGKDLSCLCRATSEAECLDACSIHGHCHCAIFDGASGACDMFWTPCDSAMLNLEHSADSPLVTALQPCMELPLEVQHSTQVHSQCVTLHNVAQTCTAVTP